MHEVQFLNIRRDKNKNKKHTKAFGHSLSLLAEQEGCSLLNSKLGEKCGFAWDSAGCFLR